MLWSSFTVGKREHEWALQNYAIKELSQISKKKYSNSNNHSYKRKAKIGRNMKDPH